MAGPITHSKPKWQAIRDQAAEWVVRRAAARPGDASDEAFQAWLDADLSNEIAFEQEQATWRRTEDLSALRALDPGVLEPEPQERVSRTLRRAPSLVARRAFIGGGMAAAAGLGGLAVWGSTGSKAYATGVGERRSVQLQSGGKVELNTETSIVLRRTLSERVLELQAGEALFDLKGGGDLDVRVAGARMRGPDSTFSVRRDRKAVQLTVVDGLVELKGRDRAGPLALSLDKGSVLTLGPNGVSQRRIAAADLERALSWRYGKIALAGETLGRAAQEFNRYNARKIMVPDPAVAALQVGGYFDADDVDGFVHGVQQTFGVRAVERGGTVYLIPAA